MVLGLRIRSSHGCWTCRLRRKKCDEKRPKCSMCDLLEIDCLYSDNKPDWMDGGAREKEMATRMKAMVKAKANERRERKWATTLDHDHDEDKSDMLSEVLAPMRRHNISTRNLSPSESRDTHTMMHTPPDSTKETQTPPAQQVPDSASSAGGNLQSPYSPVPPLSGLIGADAPVSLRLGEDGGTEPIGERDLSFVMLYLDYVFPFLFPFYRPHLLETGRGWLLTLLLRNKTLFHTALSLASYFMSVELKSTVGDGSACHLANWRELQHQQSLALREMHKSVSTLNKCGISVCLFQSSHIMEAMVQLLCFESATGSTTTENWMMHLDAAVVLFEQIIRCHATDQENPWVSTLRGLGATSFSINLGENRHPWSSDQGAFRFYTALLVWMDIIGSTVLEQPPRLRDYHSQILEGDRPALNMEEFVGCSNWVLLLISEIAALDVWKKELKNNRSLSTVELVSRAKEIETKLRDGIRKLEEVTARRPAGLFQDPLAGLQCATIPFSGLGYEALAEYDRSLSVPAIVIHTRIWAHSALTYLQVVVSGYQPSLPDIAINVRETVDLFQQLPTKFGLRTLTWPFAVTGCLVSPEQEPVCRGLVSAMGALQVFGTVKAALSIMETMWEARMLGTVCDQHFDIATCLKATGHKILLV